MDSPIRPPPLRPLRELAGLVRGVASLPRLALHRRPRRETPASVLVLPGYLMSDGSTVALRTYLARRGHRVTGWKQGRNLGALRQLVPRVIKQVSRLHEQDGQPVHLVGWSLGGIIARETAREVPDAVAQVITMGSPVVGGPKYSVFASMSKRWGGMDLDQIEQAFADRNEVPLRVPVTALYTKRDGIVAWRACIDPNAQNGVEHVEVEGSHLGLPWSAPVLRHVARRIETLPSR